MKEFLGEQANEVERELASRERSLERAQIDIESYRTRLPDAPEGRQAFFEEQIAILDRGINGLNASIRDLTAELADLRERSSAAGAEETLSIQLPSVLVEINGGVVKASRISATGIEGEVFVPLTSQADAAGGTWQIREIVLPERNRKLDDRSLVYLDQLRGRRARRTHIQYAVFLLGR